MKTTGPVGVILAAAMGIVIVLVASSMQRSEADVVAERSSETLTVSPSVKALWLPTTPILTSILPVEGSSAGAMKVMTPFVDPLIVARAADSERLRVVRRHVGVDLERARVRYLRDLRERRDVIALRDGKAHDRAGNRRTDDRVLQVRLRGIERAEGGFHVRLGGGDVALGAAARGIRGALRARYIVVIGALRRGEARDRAYHLRARGRHRRLVGRDGRRRDALIRYRFIDPLDEVVEERLHRLRVGYHERDIAVDASARGSISERLRVIQRPAERHAFVLYVDDELAVGDRERKEGRQMRIADC